jgi:hypothetical protein
MIDAKRRDLVKTGLNPDQLNLIKKLKEMSKNAKKAPWHHGGNLGKDGKTTYKLGAPEENLIILMRNSIDDLIEIIETLEKTK